MATELYDEDDQPIWLVHDVCRATCKLAQRNDQEIRNGHWLKCTQGAREKSWQAVRTMYKSNTI